MSLGKEAEEPFSTSFRHQMRAANYSPRP